jgi:hypothetical protein
VTRRGGPAASFRASIVGLGLAMIPACAPLPPVDPGGRPGWELERGTVVVSATDLDLQLSDRQVVRDDRGRTTVRLQFSFVSHRGYVGEFDVHRSAGTLWIPAGSDGAPRRSASAAMITEYPPGSSVSRFPFFEEYGRRPASEIGTPAAVVDLRGPIVSELRNFENPDDPFGGPFTSEDQFAYSMLRSYEESGNTDLLWEESIARAWTRATEAVQTLLEEETGDGGLRILLAGQDWSAAGAVAAAARDERVAAVVVCGRPYDWMDHHFVRWRRWERRSGYPPLAAIEPTIWSGSRDVLSFLSSTWGNPDPGCPTCAGSGRRWREGYDTATLRSDGRFPAGLLFVQGDADPALPIDGLARACAPEEELRAVPGAGGFLGPFSRDRPLPIDDLCVLPDTTSTLAHPEAAAAVRGWTQHLAGYRDLPRIRVEERLQAGEVVVSVRVEEGNAPVTDVRMRLMEAGAVDPFDFKAPLHRTVPRAMPWRDVTLIYAGHDEDFRGRWEGRFPWITGSNQAYWIRVGTRVGDTAMGHSLPIRAFWHRGDPASGPARP